MSAPARALLRLRRPKRGTETVVEHLPSRTPEGEHPYLVVDDTDGRVLAELWSPEDALQLLAELDPSQRISVVVVESGGGGLVRHDSLVAVRPLFPNPPAPEHRRPRP
jgi:hypothetical protein